MGWFRDGHSGHAGYVIGLVEYEGGEFRELLSGPATGQSLPTHVQVVCACGWRSSQRPAPASAKSFPWLVELTDRDTEPLQDLWTAHLDEPR